MRKTIRKPVFVALFLSVALLSACDSESDEQSTANEENVAPAQTAAPAEANARRVFEAEVGETKIEAFADGEGSAQVPDWVPGDFPFPEGGRIQVAVRISDTDGIMHVVVNKAAGSMAQDLSDALEANGWSGSEPVAAATAMMYRKDKKAVIVVVTQDEDDQGSSVATLTFSSE